MERSLLGRLASVWTSMGMRDLMRTQPATMGVWVRNVRAVEEALGPDEAWSYTRLLLAAASSGQATELAAELPDLMARVEPGHRERFHRLLVAVIEDRPQAVLVVAHGLPALLCEMDDVALTDFVAQALVVHEQSPARAEGFLRLESESGQVAVEKALGGVTLRSMHRQLTMYARAHCGLAVQVRPGGQRSFTDGRHLYLPDRVNRFGDERDRVVYLVRAAQASGFIEFGSLDIDLDGIEGPWVAAAADEMPFERMLRSFQNPVIARVLFLLFERTRIDAAVREAYPGVGRRIDALGLGPDWSPHHSDSPVDGALDAVARGMLGEVIEGSGPAPEAARRVLDLCASTQWTSVHDVIRTVLAASPHIEALLEHAPISPSIQIPVGLEPEALSEADKAIEARAASLLRSLEIKPDWKSAREIAQGSDTDGLSYDEMSDFLDRMEAPDGPERSDKDDDFGGSEASVLRADVDPDAEVAVFRYREWDVELGEYKAGWVRLSEYRLLGGDADFVDTVLAEHGSMIRSLRRSFEALRPDAMGPRRGLTDGDELDFDAVVAARVAKRAGTPGPLGLYRARRRNQRDVSVAFLVDMSSSTNEHINTASKRIIDVEREALVVTAEAIAALGDPMAIYGYSGFGREQVAFYVAKEFDEPWGPKIRERIGGIGWKMENRDGAAIRHATAKLLGAPGSLKLLILLSDGKPLDCGCAQYSDLYAQEDTRMALVEARAAGVHPFCITVDPHGRSYLRRIYGEGGYTIIDSVGSLPARLPTIYRRLTR
jgi:hypothetical protein